MVYAKRNTSQSQSANQAGGQAGTNADPKPSTWEPSWDIVERGKITLWCGTKSVGFIDADETGLPGITFFTPAKKAVGGGETERRALREEAYSVVAKHKENKEDPRIDQLAKLVKAKKKEAAKRDESLVFNTSKALTPNTSVARLLLAATRAMKEVLGPAIDAHHCYQSRAGSSPAGPQNRGGEGQGVTIETLVDSGATHPLLDTLTCEEAGVQINTQDSSSFAVASGPDFVTAGTTKEPIPFETESTDHEPMVLNVHQGHVADLGGKKGGKAKAKNLLDVVQTLVMGMGLMVVFGKNATGNWGGALIDVEKGMQAPLPLNDDLLPVLKLKNGRKYKFNSVPDSLDQLAQTFGKAAEARRKRLAGRGFHEARHVPPPPEPQEATNTSEQALYDDWMEKEWEANEAANKLSQRKSAPRTTKTSHVYTAQSAHNLLHRNATETRKALNHPEVKFYSNSTESVKRGDELEDSDLQVGKCSLCSQFRAVAPTQHGQGHVHWTCESCHGTAFPSRE